MKRWLLKQPSAEDIIHLFLAWRVWLVGAIAGAVILGLVYAINLPAYQAQATVTVDHNAEQVLPLESSNRDVNTYLQRETDKLLVLAWSDEVVQPVSDSSGIPLADLRQNYLGLSQPNDGGWHFTAESQDAEQAQMLANAWAQEFYTRASAAAQSALAPSSGETSVINPYLTLSFSQSAVLPDQRVLKAGVYLFAGSLLGAILAGLGFLFISNRED